MIGELFFGGGGWFGFNNVSVVGVSFGLCVEVFLDWINVFWLVKVDGGVW